MHQAHEMIEASSFILHASSFFGYLLNVAYLAVIALAFPWLLYQRLRHGKYREGFGAKFWGRRSQASPATRPASGCTPSASAK